MNTAADTLAPVAGGADPGQTSACAQRRNAHAFRYGSRPHRGRLQQTAAPAP
jgi:hypothetical protein